MVKINYSVGKMCLGQAEQNCAHIQLFVLHCTGLVGLFRVAKTTIGAPSQCDQQSTAHVMASHVLLIADCSVVVAVRTKQLLSDKSAAELTSSCAHKTEQNVKRKSLSYFPTNQLQSQPVHTQSWREA